MILILAVWEIISLIINAPLILPGVPAVGKEIIRLCSSGNFWLNFLYSFARIIISFLISVILGFLLGCLSGLVPVFKTLLEIPVSAMRATPVISVILIALFWFKSNTVPVFVCVLMALPIVITGVSNGFSQVDKKLLEMAEVYKLSLMKTFFAVKLPSVMPFFLNAIVQSFGLCWKVVIAGEVMCIPKKGLGSLMQVSQVHLETATVIAATVILVTVSFAMEQSLKKIIVCNKISV